MLPHSRSFSNEPLFYVKVLCLEPLNHLTPYICVAKSANKAHGDDQRRLWEGAGGGRA